MKSLVSASNRERGAAFLEYALVVSLIALLAMATVQMLGEAVSDSLTESANAIIQQETVEASTTTTVGVRIRPTPPVRGGPANLGRIAVGR